MVSNFYQRDLHNKECVTLANSMMEQLSIPDPPLIYFWLSEAHRWSSHLCSLLKTYSNIFWTIHVFHDSRMLCHPHRTTYQSNTWSQLRKPLETHRLWQNNAYTGSLEAGLQSSNKEQMYGLVCLEIHQLGRNNPYTGSLEAGLQSSNKEPMYGLVRPPSPPSTTHLPYHPQ